MPVLLVIDDLDSLDQDKQIELYSRIAQLFDQALSRESPSRVLFTSRLEPNAGANRLIKISGFGREETLDYTRSLIKHLGGSESWGPLALSSIDSILNASKGSPIFIASILRLASFGDELESVIANWNGRDGEDVRRFAFKREIDSLTYTDRRVLYVLQLLASSTLEELVELVGEDRPHLQASLLRMSQFHLFAGNANPVTGAQISVPEPIRLMIGVTEANLHASDAEELKKRAAKAVNRPNEGQTEVGRSVRGVTLLWRRKRHAEALIEAQRICKAYPSHGEASFILGRTYLLQEPPDFEAADEAFKEASYQKYDRPNLLEYWALTRLKKGDIPGLIKITGDFLAPKLSGLALLYRLAGIYRLARTREEQGDHAAALQSYQRLMHESTRALRANRTEPVTANVSRIATDVPSYIIEAAYNAYRRGSLDRILTHAVQLTKDGYPPLQNLGRIISDILAQCSELKNAGRDIGLDVKATLKRREDGLYEIGRQLAATIGGGHRLTQRVLQVAKALQNARQSRYN